MAFLRGGTCYLAMPLWKFWARLSLNCVNEIQSQINCLYFTHKDLGTTFFFSKRTHLMAGNRGVDMACVREIGHVGRCPTAVCFT